MRVAGCSAAKVTKRTSIILASKSSADFLPCFHHANISFSLIVIKSYATICKEALLLRASHMQSMPFAVLATSRFVQMNHGFLFEGLSDMFTCPLCFFAPMFHRISHSSFAKGAAKKVTKEFSQALIRDEL